ncbi:hypothetical protein ACHQM5_005081 [Ranunculus cassubicifolius]
MQTPNSTLSSPLTPSSSSKPENPNSNNTTPSSSSTLSRLWRPAAQRNLRNQWMKLVSHKQKWISASSAARSHATSLVNAYLSQRYLPSMDLGALKDMPSIREKSCQKLSSQQELCKKNLLSSYKDMVGVVSLMINDSRSMRCFTKRSGASPLLQYSSHSEDNNNDLGDGGGIPVFTFLSIPYHEKLGQELVQMFASELLLKRLIVVELLSLSCKEEQNDKLSWSNELYPGEFEDLRSSVLFCEDTHQPISPRINGGGFEFLAPSESNIRADREVLHVYLTTWLVEVNIDTQRIEDIFIIIGEEMHRSLS